MCFLFSVKKLAVASLNHAEQVGAIQFVYYISKIKNLMLSILYPASVQRWGNYWTEKS